MKLHSTGEGTVVIAGDDEGTRKDRENGEESDEEKEKHGLDVSRKRG